MASRKLMFGTVAVSMALAPGVLFVSDAAAKKIKCAADEVSIPDDRPAGGNLCMSKAEWEKAKGICEQNDVKNPMECVCQDADTVGACGD
ncbi:MAG: hypothetical protein Q7T86_10130 [Hyphomicrobiaceae bacterium]|jgi:hypothetical protein|nr:hypothetical protein [Hyphomicrobiaceae bacterium]